MNKSIVQTVKIERLCIGTEKPTEFLDALERLCHSYCSAQNADNGDGYTFKFEIEG